MNIKKVAGFLLLKPAFTSKNLTSLALVGLFFGIYVLAGGKVTWAPKVQQGKNFGSAQTAAAPVKTPPKAAAAPVSNYAVRSLAASSASSSSQDARDAEVPVKKEKTADLGELQERLKNLEVRRTRTAE